MNPSKAQPTCALVILNYNGRAVLEKCLPSVVAAANKGEGHQVVVVDNGSDDDSLGWLRQNFPEAVVHIARENKFLVSYNDYLFESQHRYVFLLNNDVILDENCIAPMLRHFEDETVFSVAPLIYNEGEVLENARTFLRFRKGRVHYGNLDLNAGETGFSPASAGMYDRTKLLSFGGFDELFLPMYGEEIDLTLSAARRGWKIVFEPQAKALHLGGVSINSAVKKFKRRASLIKNRHLMVAKHIHNPRLVSSYFMWTLLLLPSRIFTLDKAYIRGSLQALQSLPFALKQRRREQAATKFSDLQIFKKLSK